MNQRERRGFMLGVADVSLGIQAREKSNGDVALRGFVSSVNIGDVELQRVCLKSFLRSNGRVAIARMIARVALDSERQMRWGGV